MDFSSSLPVWEIMQGMLVFEEDSTLLSRPPPPLLPTPLHEVWNPIYLLNISKILIESLLPVKTKSVKKIKSLLYATRGYNTEITYCVI